MENFGEKNRKIPETASGQADLKEGDFLEKPLSAAETAELEKLRVGAANVIKCFALKRSTDNKKGENLVIVTDAGVDELMRRALYESGRQIVGNDCRLVVAPKTERSAQDLGAAVGEKMKTADALLLLTSLSRTHSEETKEVLFPRHNAGLLQELLNSEHLATELQTLKKFSGDELAEKMSERKSNPQSEFPARARIISITNSSRETLMTGGALEDTKEMAARIDRFAEAIKGVEKVKITSANGTDLELDLKVPTFFKETGLVEKPGQVANFPSGEYGGAVDLEGTSGVYAVDGALGEGIGRVDEPIKITIVNGVATKIEGGQSAEKLKEILGQAEKEYRQKNPNDKTTSAWRMAEFSCGMNPKAFRYENGQRVSPPTSLEGEKGLGTVHIAFGKNSLFGVKKDDPDYNDISIHIDCVAMQTSVVGTRADGSKMDIIKDGQVVCL